MPEKPQAVFHETYELVSARAAYWWATYEGGEKYKRAADELGQAVLPRYDYETDAMYKARLGATPVDELAEDLVGKRVGELFKQPVVRPALQREEGQSNAVFSAWMADVDRRGTSMTDWMRDRLRDALVAGRVYVGVDAPRQESIPENATQADVQVRAELRPYLVHADVRNVVDWEEGDDGRLKRIVIRYEERTKASLTDKPATRRYYMEWTPTEWRRYAESRGRDRSTELTPAGEGKHQFGRVPWLAFEPLAGPSYVGRLASLLRAATRTSSHMESEEVAVVFTTPIITGCAPEELAKAQLGPGMAMAIPNPDASVTTFSHDPAVMATLREQRAMKIASAMRRAESADGVRSVQPSSGVAKAYEFQGLGALLQGLSRESQATENALIELWGLVAAVPTDDLAQSQYPQEFDVLSEEAVFERYRWIVENSGLPVELVRMVLIDLVQRLFPIDSERRRAVLDAIKAWSPSIGAQILRQGIGGSTGRPFQGAGPGPMNPGGLLGTSARG